MNTSKSPVGSGMRVVHVRTGERALTQRVDDWLTGNQVQTTACADAFEACVALAPARAVPDLVLIGLDWLTDAELVLLEFVRKSWNSALLIAYSNDRARRIIVHHAMTHVCSDSADLATVLSKTPAEWLQSARNTARETLRGNVIPATVASPVAPSQTDVQAISDLPIPRLDLSNKNLFAEADNRVNAGSVAAPTLSDTVVAARNDSELVTRDELAALLSTYFR